MVDIMLVLLIIFMITAPMMQQGLGIDIPNVTARPLPTKDGHRYEYHSGRKTGPQ